MDELVEVDKKAFLFLNDLNASWLDQPMMLMSNTLLWIPLYALLLFLIVRQYGKLSWIIVLGIILTIVLSDQITSSVMKPYFERLRPSRDPTLGDIVHVVDGYRGGLYGFASSHAANTFGVATFIFLLLRKNHPGLFVLFFWALLVSYTRIYLGVHYPGDILAGALVGIASAFACVHLTLFAHNRYGLARSTSG